MRVKAMNQMRVVRSLGAGGSCWRLGVRPAAMIAAAGPITAPSVNIPGPSLDSPRTALQDFSVIGVQFKRLHVSAKREG